MSRIAISGIGIVSALGTGQEANLTALRRGRSGIIDSPRHLVTRHRLPVGEVKSSNGGLAATLGLPASAHWSRTALLGACAASEAIEDSGIFSSGAGSEAVRRKTGLVSATSVGGMDLTEHFFEDFINDENKGRLRDVRMHDCGASTAAIAGYCGIKGYVTTVSTACSSSANAIAAGVRLLEHKIVDAVVVGGTDSLSAFTLNGFNSLMILDKRPCRPFDEGRAGLNLGEGAAYLVLQREEDLSRKPYCYVAACANRNDAYHQTASSEDGSGAYSAMRDAIEKSGLKPENVDYINAHGTGTRNNDSSEASAISRLFPSPPEFSSTKGYTGHTLAAAGAIEAVISCLSISNGCIFPNLNWERQMEDTMLRPVSALIENKELDVVLSNSFGFGGNCTSVLLTRK